MNERDAAAVWAGRARTAYAALIATYWKRCQRLFRVTTRHRFGMAWQYWIQAHALDAVTDAALMDRLPAERARAGRLVLGLRRRTLGRLERNDYYDDLAWMALALHRANLTLDVPTRPLVDAIWIRLRTGYDPNRGALVWRRGDDFCNVAANAPTAIFAARLGHIILARHLTDWLHDTLVRDGHVLDGVHADGRIAPGLWTYNYGTLIGADVALYQITNDAGYLARASSTAHAAIHDLAPAGLWPDEGSGDGGMFKGILARYLGELVAVSGDRAVRATLEHNAAAAWTNRTPSNLIGSDWTHPPAGPIDLSAHLSGVTILHTVAKLHHHDEDGPDLEPP